MHKGREKAEWDRNAALQQTLLCTGLSRPKRIPKLDDLNPVRRKEKEDKENEAGLDDFDAFEADVKKTMR